MESQRSLLFIALLVVSFLLYQQWQQDNAPVIQETYQTDQLAPVETSTDEFVPQATSTTTNLPAALENTARIITINTDVLALKINTQGGDIVDAKLLNYETEQHSGTPITILQNGAHKYIAQSGLTGNDGLDRIIPGRPVYHTAQNEFQLLADKQQLIVDLSYNATNDLVVTKRFTLVKGSYAVNVDYILTNNSESDRRVQLYAQLKQASEIESSSGMLPTYRGAAYSTDEDRYEKYAFDDFEESPLNKTTHNGWVAMIEHYFVSAWVPNKTDANHLYSSFTSAKDAVIGFKAPEIIVPAHGEAMTSARFYVGPKNQEVLKNMADGLDLTVDYGFLFMISQPLFWLLVKIQSIVGNWGFAIIIITLIVKGAMYPLTKAQYTSMAKMRELQPKMASLKERFGDDRQKMSQAMMELYRKEKVNPAGGCLPLILQMPIFLALYWVFLESVELRHATFGLWIHDLSSKDPYFILPILMGVSMFIMQKMQPTTVQDPMQQKMMQYMPVFFTVFFFWFPAGLVLYWFVSNLISIAQMKIIFSGIEKAKVKAATK